MSQSITLYRISWEYFEKLNSSSNAQKFAISSAKSYATFQGSFMALEYVLSKGLADKDAEALKMIFNPKEVIGNENFDAMSPDEQSKYCESSDLIHYLNPLKISETNQILGRLPPEVINANYDAEELNGNGIFPSVWHNDNSPDQAYNRLQLEEDYEQLKSIFDQAAEERDYILVFA